MHGARRGLVLLLVGSLLAVAAAGCGSSGSKSAATTATEGFTQYESQMQALGQTLGAALVQAGTANRTATPKQMEANLRKTQRALRTAASSLEQITPPADVAAQHKLLAMGVREYANEIGGVITKLRHGDRQAVFAVTTLKGVKDMQQASLAISKAGYIIVLGG